MGSGQQTPAAAGRGRAAGGANAAFCSWSGGKDAALAVDEARRQGFETRLLLTMMTEGGQRSRSHGLSRQLLEAQADAAGLPIRFAAAAWNEYERAFIELAAEARRDSFRTGIFGDIDIEHHRAWVLATCKSAGVDARLPLWGRRRRELLDLLLSRGFRALIIAVRADAAPADLLGAPIDAALVRRLERSGIDPSGEGGEYHSLVVDGPIFRRPLRVRFGHRTLRDGVWFLDCALY